MPDTLYSTVEVAALLKLHKRRVANLAETLGVGRKVGSGWVFTDADVRKLRRRNKKPGKKTLGAK